MKRAFIPGAVDRHGIARPLPECCGGCQQGHEACDCQLSDATPLRPRTAVLVRPAITVHRIPITRRARRFMRTLLSFLCAPRFRG